jgi:hypothetical protein
MQDEVRELGSSLRVSVNDYNQTWDEVVGQFEFPMAPSLGDGVILGVAVFQAERGISRYDTVCNGDPSPRW